MVPGSFNGSQRSGIYMILLTYLMVAIWLPQAHSSHPYMSAPGRRLWGFAPASSPLQSTSLKEQSLFQKPLAHFPVDLTSQKCVTW